MQVLRPNEASVTRAAHLDLDLLARGAGDHKLGPLEALRLLTNNVVDEDLAILVLVTHRVRMLPGEQVEGALGRVVRVQWAHLEAIKTTIGKSKWEAFLLRLRCLDGEAGNNCTAWL